MMLQLEEYNYETYEKIVQLWPWASISPTLHLVLGHSHEIIALDGGRGLGNKTEQHAEAVNNPLRNLKKTGCRSHDEKLACLDCYNKGPSI